MSTPADAPANASAALSTALVDELVRGGLRHVVLAPGSRSAALAFAVHAAALDGRLTLHTRIDERSAGFLGLGLATTSRSPVAVVTTSGTAVANLHPAVLEAAHRGIPLLLLTADRPAHLRGTQSNQTTDQVRLFGGATRWDADAAPGDPDHDQAAQVAVLARARLPGPRRRPRAAGDAPGPVQLNLQLSEPLVPQLADGWVVPVDGRPEGAPWHAPAADARPGAVRAGGRAAHRGGGRRRRRSAGPDPGRAQRLAAARRAHQRLAHRGQRDPHLPAAARRAGPRRPHRAGRGLRPPDPLASGDPADLQRRRRGRRGPQRHRFHRPRSPGVAGAGLAGRGLGRSGRPGRRSRRVLAGGVEGARRPARPGARRAARRTPRPGTRTRSPARSPPRCRPTGCCSSAPPTRSATST